MHEGEVVQLGSPQDLFERPVHRFVGYFIGSPGMNFVPCRPAEGGLAIDGTDIVLPGPWAAQAKAQAHRRLELGVRPEFIEVRDKPGEGTVQAQLVEVEDLGNYRLLTARLGPHAIKAKLLSEVELRADTVDLFIPPAWMRLYADQRLVD